jgi:NADH-quinone oxidoreductase subunit J
MDQQTFLFWTIAGLTGVSAIAVVVTQNIVRAAAWLLFTLGGTAGIYFLIGADFVGATQLIVYVGGILVLVVFGVMLTAQGPFVTLRAGAAEWVVALGVGILLFGVLAYTTYTTAWAKTSDPRMQDATNSTSSARLGLAFLGFKEITPKDYLTGVPGQQLSGKIVSAGRQEAVLRLDDADGPRKFRVARNARVLDENGQTFPWAGLTPETHVAITTQPDNREIITQFQLSKSTLGEKRQQMAYLLPFEIVSVHLLVVLIAAAYLARAKRRRRSVS